MFNTHCQVRKYVDDIAIVSAGYNFAHQLRDGYRAARRKLQHLNMQLNEHKTVAVANTPRARQQMRLAWKGMRMPRIAFTTRDLGVDVQFGPWRNPVQKSRCRKFQQAMDRIAMLPLATAERAFLVKLLLPPTPYGSEVGGCSQTLQQQLTTAARKGIAGGASHARQRRAKEIDLFAWGGAKLNPHVNLGVRGSP